MEDRATFRAWSMAAAVLVSSTSTIASVSTVAHLRRVTAGDAMTLVITSVAPVHCINT